MQAKQNSSGTNAGKQHAALAGNLVSIAAIMVLAVLVVLARSIGESSRGLVAAVAEAVFWGAGVLLYLAPALVAADRRHPGRKAIAVLNLLVGWTGLGWLAMLVFAFRPAAWSFGDPTGPRIPPPRKRCANCRRQLNIDADSCLYCGSVQAGPHGLSAR